MRIAFSPCPNDTFVFHAWVHGLLAEAPRLEVTYADIDQTNSMALSKDGPDILKISYAALPWVLQDYALLPCGGALGRGCGPLILTSGKEQEKNNPSQVTGKRVAVPSDRSTAYLLFRLWAAEQVPGGVGQIVIMPFHEIMPAVQSGRVDAGLVIHEARFTFAEYGLHLLTDLGSWWEEQTGLPIPLGAIIARRSLDVEAISKYIKNSVAYAWAHPEASEEYVLSYAQEMNPEVAKAHINLYVNQFTTDVGEEGYRAIHTLFSKAMQEKLIPEIDLSLLGGNE